ncbi:lipoyl(octanoyl) transferase LipB [Bdellovibrio reynosensis]|uniref:Octanoyltransferase n=1 Tax=Bdellovibrio reynosensis TaxID=2835041 RepID=A0ABY4C4U5_9BACT|nr:lipoyl(octanoyl) transferase LipB [Bdellovibrio reynosensis]UOE99753.1 lipoyl(octanoyl) transferase LipB [Bdellovibrio reynosensis]
MADLIFQDWGLIDYEEALAKQTALIEKVQEENLPGYLIFCTHSPVVTLGRATKEGDVFNWQGKVVEVSRGGRATYHGPSQLIVYPILNLTQQRKGRRDREVVGFLRVFEDSIVEVLRSYGIEAQGRSVQKSSVNESEADETGVWVGPKKLASLGIGVRRWVTYHGAAINLKFDPKAFVGMNPCGFSTDTMISLEQILNEPVDVNLFKERLKNKLLQAL